MHIDDAVRAFEKCEEGSQTPAPSSLMTWNPRAEDRSMNGKASRVKKKPIFWDRYSVNEGKSSLQVVLDWLSTETNYNKWRGSDRNNGNTKEALLKEILPELKAEGSCIAQLATLVKKNTIEKQFREAVDFQAQTGSSITSESTLREEAVGRSSIIAQRAEKRPLTLDEDDTDAKRQTKDPVDKLLEQQNRVSKQRAEKTNRMLQLQETRLKLKQREVKLKEVQANVDLTLKKVQLEFGQRKAVVQLLLSRKHLLDNGVSVVEIERLLPPPA
ncbi:hypothetical protein PHYPSEUDO_006719 [Phytophthora pseudosyringae]|uniref:Uncharacterized protein n=1 Tax=Phytophthora pseudosyringae TaxID=221518 RepID=A0A8T1VKX4_9STRA|nr:hypothetical protein PHYPSEUDO_006719 [Phytophthora pseudosyringae]